METKTNLADVIISGFRHDPKISVEATRESIIQNWRDPRGGFSKIFARLMEKVLDKSITPELALYAIDLYSHTASMLGHPGAFIAADEVYRTLTFQKYTKKGDN